MSLIWRMDPLGLFLELRSSKGCLCRIVTNFVILLCDAILVFFLYFCWMFSNWLSFTLHCFQVHDKFFADFDV